MTEVPKVTGPSGLAPAPGGPDEPVSYQAEPEVDDSSQVELETMVARHGWKGWLQQKIDNIAEYDGDQRLQKVHEH